MAQAAEIGRRYGVVAYEHHVGPGEIYGVAERQRSLADQAVMVPADFAAVEPFGTGADELHVGMHGEDADKFSGVVALRSQYDGFNHFCFL